MGLRQTALLLNHYLPGAQGRVPSIRMVTAQQIEPLVKAQVRSALSEKQNQRPSKIWWRIRIEGITLLCTFQHSSSSPCTAHASMILHERKVAYSQRCRVSHRALGPPLHHFHRDHLIGSQPVAPVDYPCTALYPLLMRMEPHKSLAWTSRILKQAQNI
jgi:hypothetical protein